MNRVCIQRNIDGDLLIYSDEPIECYFIEESSLTDRVYKYDPDGGVLHCDPDAVTELLGDDPIGHINDGRIFTEKGKIN